MSKRRSHRPLGGLFTRQEREAKAALKPTALDYLDTCLDWEMFRPALDQNLDFKVPTPGQASRGGRPPFDCVLMFKVLVLQKYHALSDDEPQRSGDRPPKAARRVSAANQCEHQILDRTSFQRFLGLALEGRIPDAKTIRSFRERLGSEGMEALFSAFDGYLRERNLLLEPGKVIDASFVDVPRQRNTRHENERIKNGEIPEGWEERPAFHRQKDTDARHTKKNNEHHYGYKNHVKTDLATKLIEQYAVSEASLHDSQALPELISEADEGTTLHADSAYRSAAIDLALEQHDIGNRIHERPWRNTPLTEAQQETNREKSRQRVRVEHIFGQQSLTGSHFIRTIGKARAAFQIGLGNLVYNLCRFTFLVRQSAI